MTDSTRKVIEMNDLTELGRSLDEPVDPIARQRRRVALMREAEAGTRVRAAWSRRWAGRRLALAAAAGSVVAAGAVFTMVATESQSSPAYAAERLPDGTIKVTIREFRDAPGLERRLRKLGVRAVITYLPPQKRCVHGPGWEKRLTSQRRQVFELVNVLNKDRVPVDYKEAIVHPERIPAGYTIYVEVLYDPARNGDKSLWGGEVIGTMEALASGPADRCVPTSWPPPHKPGPGRPAN